MYIVCTPDAERNYTGRAHNRSEGIIVILHITPFAKACTRLSISASNRCAWNAFTLNLWLVDDYCSVDDRGSPQYDVIY